MRLACVVLLAKQVAGVPQGTLPVESGWELLGHAAGGCESQAQDPPLAELIDAALPGCEFACALRAECTAFEWYVAPHGGYTRCTLLHGTVVRSSASASSSGYVCYTRQCGRDCVHRQRRPSPPAILPPTLPPTSPPPPPERCASRVGPYADLHLCKDDFVGADLRGSNLRNANLGGIRLDGALLDGADLSGANMRRASCVNASFRHALLFEAELSETTLTRATFQWADLRSAKLRRASIERASFATADLRGIDLTFASHASHVQFDRALLTDTHIADVVLPDASFMGCDIRGTVWEFCILTRANFVDVRTRGGRVTMVDVQADFANLFSVDLSNALLTGPVSLEGADLRYAKFRGAELRGLRAKRVRAQHSDFSNSVLTGADFSRASLWRANFSNASLDAVRWRGADCAGIIGSAACAAAP